MRKFGDKNLVPLDSELERTLRRLCKGKKECIGIEQQSMENVQGFREGEEVDIQSTSRESVPQSAPPMEEIERALRDYGLPPVGIPPVIR